MKHAISFNMTVVNVEILHYDIFKVMNVQENSFKNDFKFHCCRHLNTSLNMCCCGSWIIFINEMKSVKEKWGHN